MVLFGCRDLGRFGVALGVLLAFLGSILGRSWALLGGLGAVLGGLGAVLERHAKIINKSMPKMTDFGSQKPPKMAPKSDQKTNKNRCEKRSEKRANIRRSWAALGLLLAALELSGPLFLHACALLLFSRSYGALGRSYRPLLGRS